MLENNWTKCIPQFLTRCMLTSVSVALSITQTALARRLKATIVQRKEAPTARQRIRTRAPSATDTHEIKELSDAVSQAVGAEAMQPELYGKVSRRVKCSRLKAPRAIRQQIMVKSPMELGTKPIVLVKACDNSVRSSQPASRGSEVVRCESEVDTYQSSLQLICQKPLQSNGSEARRRCICTSALQRRLENVL